MTIFKEFENAEEQLAVYQKALIIATRAAEALSEDQLFEALAELKQLEINLSNQYGPELVRGLIQQAHEEASVPK